MKWMSRKRVRGGEGSGSVDGMSDGDANGHCPDTTPPNRVEQNDCEDHVGRGLHGTSPSTQINTWSGGDSQDCMIFVMNDAVPWIKTIWGKEAGRKRRIVQGYMDDNRLWTMGGKAGQRSCRSTRVKQRPTMIQDGQCSVKIRQLWAIVSEATGGTWPHHSSIIGSGSSG
jgi:hypothetical protein